MPVSPVWGTQNSDCFKTLPATVSGSDGPGTLVITAVARLTIRSNSLSCTIFGRSPSAAKRPSVVLGS